MTDTNTPIIQLRGITKRFPGVLALNKVDLSVEAGEIHAVIGENGAGKSTLMNILAGELQPDEGEIRFYGEPTKITSPFASQNMGISVVYQELALCPNLNVAENISLSLAAKSNPYGLVNRQAFNRLAADVLARLGMTGVDLNQPVSKLPVAEQQMVEIAKAISGPLKVLILDEPNSALTTEETEHLFVVLRQLAADGVAIIYVSHRLEEVLDLSDRISILRDGQYVATLDAQETAVDELIGKMVGRVVEDLYQRSIEVDVQDEVLFSLKGLRSTELLDDISFELRKGEVLGVAGLPGSGKDELVECCFGLRRYSGEISIAGEVITVRSPDEAISHGLAFIPADRRTSGALSLLSVDSNIVAANLPTVSTLGLLSKRAMQRIGNTYVGDLDIRIATLGQQMGTLSGGNQQKVILARSLVTKPLILLLHEPTRGIDVGAKAEIYRILQELASEGVGILVVSSELPELIGQCDRILVMHNGRITGEFDRAEAAEEPILACAMGQMTHF
jgi:ribose transport system ATP-binding protein